MLRSTAFTSFVLALTAAGLSACATAENDAPEAQKQSPHATTIDIKPPTPVTAPRNTKDVMGNTLQAPDPSKPPQK